MLKLKLLWVMALLLTACTPVSAAQVQASPDPRLTGYWLDMNMGSQLVDVYNDYATEDDIARADHVSLADLLDKVEVGRRLVVFKTVPDIEAAMPRLADKIDIIGYNLEHGPANRPDEINDPVGSIQRVREIADQYGKEVAFGPDRSFALNYGAQMAPYTDIFVLQVQRVQTEPETVQDFVLSLVEDLRRANPNLEVSVQIRTEGDVMALGDLIASLGDSIDGVSILSADDYASVAQDLLAEFRATAPVEVPGPLPTPAPSKPTSPVAVAVILATPSVATRRPDAMLTPLPLATPSPTIPRDTPLRNLLTWVGIVGMGIIVTSVVGTILVYSLQNVRGR